MRQSQKMKLLLFDFIRYTQPGWVFNLIPNLSGKFASCVIPSDQVDEAMLDKSYQTRSAQLADMGYRQWYRGVLSESTKTAIENAYKERPTLKDEYIFIRKYWGSAWALFALMLRIATFKNPFREIKSFLQTKSIQRVALYDKPVTYPDFENFQSALINHQPKVAVIIPTLNRYACLKDVLKDLEKQDYKNFEVIIIDQSEPFKEDFFNGFQLDIHLIRQEEKALWTARNTAIKATDASYLLFFDDDSRVGPDWVSAHLKCLDYFQADISAGVSLAVTGQKVSESYQYFRWADQFDSGNALVKRTVFKRIGIFDEQFNGMRMGDGEFAYRAYLQGIKSISNHTAARIHLKAGSGGLREMGSWDGFRPTKWFAPKPVPSVIYMTKKYLPLPLYKNTILIGMMLSNVSYQQKGKSTMLAWSILLSILKSPVLYIQYTRSKKIAMHMMAKDKGPILLER